MLIYKCTFIWDSIQEDLHDSQIKIILIDFLLGLAALAQFIHCLKQVVLAPLHSLNQTFSKQTPCYKLKVWTEGGSDVCAHS